MPNHLTAGAFKSYPPLARELAVGRLATLQRMPLAYLPILLAELIHYDWSMPAERAQIGTQLELLNNPGASSPSAKLQTFASFRVPAQIESLDWVNHPERFIQDFTAWLWSTHQVDAFRSVAESFNAALTAVAPSPSPSMSRLGIVILGQGAHGTGSPFLRKLQPRGTLFTNVVPDQGVNLLLAHAAARAQRVPGQQPFVHWYIDGGHLATVSSPLTTLSYEDLESARSALLRRTQEIIASGHGGAEATRTWLMQLSPAEIGLSVEGEGAVLNHLALRLLTEGSGTQIFSTTFVQWAAREVLRRAQPETLVLRYVPRQSDRTMNMMLSDAPENGIDPEGSLVDAEMGAFYTWLGFCRLSGAEQAHFLAWHEGKHQALLIGPGLPKGATSNSNLNIAGLLRLLS